jgi:hypothetical protein
MQKYFFIIVSFISALGWAATAPAVMNPQEEIITFAKEDSKYLIGRIGKYTEMIDNHLVSKSGTLCQLNLDIAPDKNDAASFSISLAQTNSSEMIPAVIFKISSSDTETTAKGKKATSNRIIFDDGSASYGPPISVTESSSACGNWGSISKPTIKTFSEFVIEETSALFVMDYECGLQGSEKHTLVKTCTFF